MLSKPKIIIFALAATGNGISGGDRIFMEFARAWSKFADITIYTSQAGVRMAKQSHLPKVIKIQTIFIPDLLKKIFIGEYIWKIIFGIQLGLSMPIKNINLIYSASEFWMDALPAALGKLRSGRGLTWSASWYQTAPNPMQGFYGGRYRISALFYWLVQLPMKPIIEKLADKVLVNNVTETSQFGKKAVVVLGAVDTEKITEFKKSHKNFKPVPERAVFQGRFHPQKGVVEMIKIWKLVVDKLQNAKLVMLGDGPLMQDVKAQIAKFKLQKNVELRGFMFDGFEKYKVFSQSQLVVHPALYDSGGMASAEAMAFGSPCVGYALPAYISYYPEGMQKVPIDDQKAFAAAIVYLFKNGKARFRLGKKAVRMIESSWSWKMRSKQIYESIIK